MDQHKLENLLLQLSAEEIKANHAADLSQENLEFLKTFENFDQTMAHFSTDYLARFPNAPFWTPPVVETSRNIVPWFRRKITLPLWATGLATAAVLVLAWLALPSSETDLPGKTDIQAPSQHWSDVLNLTRSDTKRSDVSPHDNALVDALLDRGYFYFEKGKREEQKKALAHFQLAYEIQPKNKRVLQYLILAGDALNETKHLDDWRRELEVLQMK